MSVGATSSPQGAFGVVGGPLGGDTTRTRQLVDENRLSEKLREGLEADDFIIYGKASVEKYDEDNPPQKLEMGAFEDKMEPFLGSGIISRRHKDIPVGEPVREWTLDEDTEVVVGNEVLEFEAGDTLETGVIDGELWIVANLRSDTELARDTRLGAMTGDLDGFSVTVFCKEWEETQKGQRVTDLDWHSVTIGADEHIKNKDSRFGVAEFKMFEALDGLTAVTGKQAERAAVEILQELPANMSAKGDTDEKSFWDRVKEVADQKSEEADSNDSPEDEKAGEEQTDQPEDEKSEEADAEAADEKADEDEFDPEDPGDEDEDEKAATDVESVVEKVRSELSDEDAAVLEKAIEEEPEVPVDPEEDDEDEDENPAVDGELKADEIAEKLGEAGFVTEDRLNEALDKRTGSDTLAEKLGDAGFVTSEDISEKLDDRLPDEVASKEEVEEVMKAAEEVLTDVLPDAQQKAAEDAAEQTAEKMVTGETPDPSGGPAQDQEDYMEQIQNKFGSNGGNN